MRHILVTLFVVTAFETVTAAQESTARLLGTITDPTGAVVPGANVVTHNVATGLERRATSDQSGDYLIPMLAIGHYTVTVDAAGFKTSTITGARN
jgi:hypothetical protein